MKNYINNNLDTLTCFDNIGGCGDNGIRNEKKGSTKYIFMSLAEKLGRLLIHEQCRRMKQKEDKKICEGCDLFEQKQDNVNLFVVTWIARSRQKDILN